MNSVERKQRIFSKHGYRFPISQRFPVIEKNNSKVSYCTTCYNRFWQLKQVIKSNISIINNNQPAEWIIVDFGGSDSDEARDWIIKNCPRSLAKGTIKYYRRTATEPFVWNVSIAKNVAHRLATGDILVNLDGDNYLQNDDPQILRSFFAKNNSLILHQTWNNYLISGNLRALGYRIPYSAFLEQYTGSNGRISMSREHFEKLGGYDEEMVFMGFQDTDLMTRAVILGLNYYASPPKEPRPIFGNRKSEPVFGSRKSVPGPYKGSVFQKTGPYKGAATDDSIGNARTRPYANNTVKSWKEAEAFNRHLSMKKIRAGKLVVNQDGFAEDLGNFYLLS